MVKNYKVITLCGSTRFKKEFLDIQKELTLKGNIVISVGLFGHSGDSEVWENMDEGTLTKTKEMLDDMHKRKIDMADEIFVINVGGYIGESTKSEIEYAISSGKKVNYLEDKKINKLKELITKNLILRKAKPEDLEQIWTNIWKDETIAQTMLWKPTKTKEEAIDRLKRTIEYQNNNYAYFVCLKSNNEPIGFAGIKEIKDGVYEESGICIARKYQGKGYAKEVVSALKKLIFEELNGNKFLYGCFTNNEKSKKVCLSQGFIYSHQEKTTREWDNQEFIIDYYYFDKNMYK